MTFAEIQSLCDDQVPESRALDYKGSLYDLSKDRDKREFLKDITSMANTQGGRIVIGIEEARDADNKGNGLPMPPSGVTVPNFDQWVLQATSLLSQACEPPLHTVDFRKMDGFPQGSVVVAEIRRSWIGPHRVRENGQFYLRANTQNNPMGIQEIRQSFLLADTVGERMKRWRNERVSLVSVGQGQIPNVTTGMSVVHVLPLESFTGSLEIDVTEPGLNRALPFAFEGGERPRLNFDGIISTVMPENRKTSYSQLWRNGVFEGVTEVGTNNGPGGNISAEHWENMATQYVFECLSFLAKRGITRNVFVCLSLTGCLGRVFWGDRKMEIHQLDRDILLLPEVEIQDITNIAAKATVRKLLAPAFDVAYQAVGLLRSPYSP